MIANKFYQEIFKNLSILGEKPSSLSEECISMQLYPQNSYLYGKPSVLPQLPHSQQASDEWNSKCPYIGNQYSSSYLNYSNLHNYSVLNQQCCESMSPSSSSETDVEYGQTPSVLSLPGLTGSSILFLLSP